jgi:hypothetical protein
VSTYKSRIWSSSLLWESQVLLLLVLSQIIGEIKIDTIFTLKFTAFQQTCVIMNSGATARLVARAAALSHRNVGRIAGQRWRSTLCTASTTSVCHHQQQRRSCTARSFSSSVGDEEQERMWSRAVGNHQFVESENEAEEQRMLEQAELVAKLEQHGE